MKYIEDSYHNKWSVYSGSLLCVQQPYDEVQTSKKELRKLLRENHCWFARWTSNFDSKQETAWWYCLREAPLTLDYVGTNYRNKVRKGLKNANFFLVDENQFEQHREDIWQIVYQSFATYPSKYRPSLNKEHQLEWYLNCCKQGCLWGGVSINDGCMCCIAVLVLNKDVVNLAHIKVNPKYQNQQINAGFAYAISDHYLNKLGYRYVVDGERNIKHETNYQDFLSKYLGFRKVYCRLNIVYRPLIGIIVYLLYPFRNIIKSLSENNQMVYNVYATLKQEEYRRHSN